MPFDDGYLENRIPEDRAEEFKILAKIDNPGLYEVLEAEDWHQYGINPQISVVRSGKKSIHDIIEEQMERYRTVIKPLIEKEDYLKSLNEMKQFLSKLFDYDEDLKKLHMGIEYLAQAVIIFDRLAEFTKPHPNTLKRLEAFAAQTKLPKG